MPSSLNRIRAAAVGDPVSLQAGFNYYGRCYQVIPFNICLLSPSQAALCPEPSRSHITTYIQHRANRFEFWTEIMSQCRAILSVVIWLLSVQRLNRKSCFFACILPPPKKARNQRALTRQRTLSPLSPHNYFCCEWDLRMLIDNFNCAGKEAGNAIQAEKEFNLCNWKWVLFWFCWRTRSLKEKLVAVLFNCLCGSAGGWGTPACFTLPQKPMLLGCVCFSGLKEGWWSSWHLSYVLSLETHTCASLGC